MCFHPRVDLLCKLSPLPQRFEDILGQIHRLPTSQDSLQPALQFCVWSLAKHRDVVDLIEVEAVGRQLSSVLCLKDRVLRLEVRSSRLLLAREATGSVVTLSLLLFWVVSCSFPLQ